MSMLEVSNPVMPTTAPVRRDSVMEKFAGVGESLGQTMTKRKKQDTNRTFAIHEVVSTETSYVLMLKSIIDLYICPLQELQAKGKKPIPQNDDIQTFFHNVEMMVIL